MLVILAVCGLLVAVNALYVAAEFAAVSVRESQVARSAEDGSRLAQRLLPILREPRKLDAYIAACQVGITLSSLILGAYAQAQLSDRLAPAFEAMGGLQDAAAESVSATVILLALTVTQMVLGELVPKSLALQFSGPVALVSVLPMELSLRVLAPLIRVLNGSGWAVLRLLGMAQAGHRHLHSPDEIRYLVAESARGGHLDGADQRRLQRALALGSLSVRRIMVPRTGIEALPCGTTVEEALARTRALPFSRYPVYRGTLDGIEGFVHVRDLVLAHLAGRGSSRLETLARPILGVPEELAADRLLNRMRTDRAVMALAVDEYGGVAGLVTIQDLLTELFGDVADEPRPEELRAQRLDDGSIRLPGRLAVQEAEEYTGLRWSGFGDTVNGVVTRLLGRFPSQGDVVELDEARIVVESLDGVLVRSVLVAPADAQRSAGSRG